MSDCIELMNKFANAYLAKFAKKDQFVYHLKSKSFKGDTIYPLSTLETEKPSIYKQQMKKYEGREKQPLIRIDCLDCQWRDCINFSALNPLKIFQMEELLGIPGYKRGEDVEILKFNIKDFKDFDFCLYDDNKNPKKTGAYKKIKPGSYKEQEFVPTETAKYFAESKEKGELPLLFSNVNHILVKGNVPLEWAEVIQFKATVT